MSVKNTSKFSKIVSVLIISFHDYSALYCVLEYALNAKGEFWEKSVEAQLWGRELFCKRHSFVFINFLLVYSYN